MRIIKKYKNRIMYDTQTSKPVTLKQLAQMIRENVAVRILDNATGKDITRLTILQTLTKLEQTGHGVRELFPSFLSWSVRTSRDDFRSSLKNILREKRERSGFEQSWSLQLVNDAIKGGIVDKEKADLLNEVILARMNELYEEIVNHLDSHIAEKTKNFDRLLASPAES